MGLFKKKEFKFRDGEILAYLGDNTQVIVPEIINEQEVTRIGPSAFYYKGLTSITLPVGIEEIGGRAFEANQIINLIIPKSIEVIGPFAFCSNFLANVEIGRSVTEIGHYAFANNQLTSVFISNCINSIGDFAFDANPLTSVSLPEGFKAPAGVFGPDADITFRSREERDFAIRELIKGTGHIDEYKGDKEDLIIPGYIDGLKITSIGLHAFQHKGLTNVQIPDTVTVIYDDAFSGNKLKSVIIPDSVERIFDRAFAFNQLTSVKLSRNIETIGNSAFSYNPELFEVMLPEKIKSQYLTTELWQSFDRSVDFK